MINQKVNDKASLAPIKSRVDNASNIINMIIIDTLRDPLLVIDEDLKILWANRSFFEFFQVKPENTMGKEIFAIGNGQWDIPELRKLLDEILQKETVINDFEVEHDFPIIGHKVMKINARMTNLIKGIKGGSKEILLAIEDFTEAKQKVEEDKEYEARFRRLFETAQDGLLLIDHRIGKIVNVNKAIVELLGFSSEELLGRSLFEVGLTKDSKFQNILKLLKEYGLIKYSPLQLTTKAGIKIDTEVNIMNRTKLIQCNVRLITEPTVDEIQKYCKDGLKEFTAQN
jgi:PAS domain S-box-containing protein